MLAVDEDFVLLSPPQLMTTDGRDTLSLGAQVEWQEPGLFPGLVLPPFVDSTSSNSGVVVLRAVNNVFAASVPANGDVEERVKAGKGREKNSLGTTFASGRSGALAVEVA